MKRSDQINTLVGNITRGYNDLIQDVLNDCVDGSDKDIDVAITRAKWILSELQEYKESENHYKD